MNRTPRFTGTLKKGKTSYTKQGKSTVPTIPHEKTRTGYTFKNIDRFSREAIAFTNADSGAVSCGIETSGNVTGFDNKKHTARFGENDVNIRKEEHACFRKRQNDTQPENKYYA